MPEVVDTVATDSTGHATAELEAGEYELVGSAAGYEPATVPVTLDSNQSVSIALSEGEPEHVTTVATDSAGHASVELEAGEYQLIGSADGYEPAAETVTLDSDRSVSIALADRDPNPGDFSYETYLADGQWTIIADHPDHWADIDTVGISGGPQRHDVTLEPYGDGIDPSEMGVVDTLQTAADGTGAFSDIDAGDYVLSFEHGEYKTKTLSIDHEITSEIDTELQALDPLNPPDEREPEDPLERPQAGDPVGFDPGVSLPTGDPHFEVAVLETDAGSDFAVPVLVTNAGGETGATTLRLTLDSTEEVVTTRELTLVPGGAAIVRLSVRSLARRVALPASVTVSTVADAETFDLQASVDPRRITGPGLPDSLGGASTLGADNPSTLGPDREPITAPGRDFPSEGWALTLEQPNGDRRYLTALTSDPDIEDVHSKASSWSVTVPADPSLAQWNYNVRAFLTRGGDLVNIGWCDSVESSTDGQETTLSGPGPLGDLPGDDVEVEIQHMIDWRAAQHIVETVAPEWDWTVLRTEEPLLVEDESYSGNPLSIIKSFCEDYSLYFRPSQTHFRQGTIFAPGGVASSVDLSPISFDESESSEGYANEVVFAGDGVTVTEPDEEEIRRLARDRDVRIADARETVRVEDDGVTAASKARERAKAELRERVTNYEAGGSLELPARRIQPGLAYSLPTDDEVWHGARSARLTGEGSIELPSRMLSRLDRDGAVAVALRIGEWAEYPDAEIRLLGAWGSGGAIQASGARLGCDITTDAGTGLLAHAFASMPAAGTWHIIHYAWSYDAGADETTLQAGHDGTVVETDTARGAVRTADYGNVALGRYGQEYLGDGIIDEAWFFDGAQASDRYARLAAGDRVPAADLVAHYPLEESPGETAAHDRIGGWHGERDGTEPGGHPVVLDSASHDLTTTTAEFNTQMTFVDALRPMAQQ